MSTDEELVPAMNESTPQAGPCNSSPMTVYMEDALGTIFLGVLSILLLIGWRRTETRYRKLMKRLELTAGAFPAGVR